MAALIVMNEATTRIVKIQAIDLAYKDQVVSPEGEAIGEVNCHPMIETTKDRVVLLLTGDPTTHRWSTRRWVWVRQQRRTS